MHSRSAVKYFKYTFTNTKQDFLKTDVILAKAVRFMWRKSFRQAKVAF